jgi:DNA-binding transcriptional MerR regulator
MPDTLNTPSSVTGANTSTRFTRLYNNQFFDYLSEQLPRNHSEMFKWCELVYANSPVLVNGIKKLINYPITKFVYKSDSKDVKEQTKKLIETDLDLYSHLLNLGLDYYIYGNTFRSIYFPFVRHLKCRVCNTEINITHAKYKMKKGEFILTCSECHKTAKAEFIDRDVENFGDIRLVTWDPKNIELSSNTVTGSNRYFYKMPPSIRKGIENGDPNIVANIPKVFFEAYKKNKAIEFTNNFNHLRSHVVAGFSTGWGVSPLVPCLKLYMYTAILRKSVESIGLEHITPQRILFPQGTSNDPSLMTAMGDWKEQVQKALTHWRRDPNYVMMAPYPTGVANIGSQGRGLMPTQEIKAAEEDMLRALDIPIEFVYGSTNLNNSAVSLRLMENQLRPYVAQITAYVNWIIDTINAKYGKNFCHIEFSPFTLSDDLQQKQLLMQAMGSGVSKRTIQEALNLDSDDEEERLVEDAIRDMKVQKRVQEKQQEMEDDIAAQARQDTQAEETGTIPKYNQQKMIASAQQMVAQLLAVPYEERRSHLAQLKGEDYVMYSVVTNLLDSAHDKGQGKAIREQQS